eukprot:329316_1
MNVESNKQFNELQKLYHNTRNSKATLQRETAEIICILGGIEGVLDLLLIDTNKSELNPTQINKLYNLMDTSSTSILEPVTTQTQSFKITLNTANDILHKLFEFEIAEKIKSFVMSIWHALILILWTILFVTIKTFWVDWVWVITIVVALLLIPLFTYLMTFNIDMLKAVTTRFDFLFQLYNIIAYRILRSMLIKEIWKRPDTWLENIGGVMIVIVIVCGDAAEIPRYTKMSILVFFIAIWGSFYATTYFQGTITGDDQYEDIQFQILGNSISLRNIALALLSNSLIFFGKQLFFMIKSATKTNVLTVRPDIEWITVNYVNDIKHDDIEITTPKANEISRSIESQRSTQL